VVAQKVAAKDSDALNKEIDEVIARIDGYRSTDDSTSASRDQMGMCSAHAYDHIGAGKPTRLQQDLKEESARDGPSLQSLR
jgi:hypothetical protein